LSLSRSKGGTGEPWCEGAAAGRSRMRSRTSIECDALWLHYLRSGSDSIEDLLDPRIDVDLRPLRASSHDLEDHKPTIRSRGTLRKDAFNRYDLLLHQCQLLVPEVVRLEDVEVVHPGALVRHLNKPICRLALLLAPALLHLAGRSRVRLHE